MASFSQIRQMLYDVFEPKKPSYNDGKPQVIDTSDDDVSIHSNPSFTRQITNESTTSEPSEPSVPQRKNVYATIPEILTRLLPTIFLNEKKHQYYEQDMAFLKSNLKLNQTKILIDAVDDNDADQMYDSLKQLHTYKQSEDGGVLKNIIGRCMESAKVREGKATFFFKSADAYVTFVMGRINQNIPPEEKAHQVEQLINHVTLNYYDKVRGDGKDQDFDNLLRWLEAYLYSQRTTAAGSGAPLTAGRGGGSGAATTAGRGGGSGAPLTAGRGGGSGAATTTAATTTAATAPALPPSPTHSIGALFVTPPSSPPSSPPPSPRRPGPPPPHGPPRYTLIGNPREQYPRKLRHFPEPDDYYTHAPTGGLVEGYDQPSHLSFHSQYMHPDNT